MRKNASYCLTFALFTSIFTPMAHAGEADVTHAELRKTGANVFSVDVTVEHADEGWDHYANKWDVMTPDGELIGTRTLLHPHVGEQPFTRSLGNIPIPQVITEVIIRAHDSVHEYGGKIFKITVPH